MKCNTWARRFGKNLIFRRPRTSFWIGSGLPTIQELSRGGSNRNAQYSHFYGLRVLRPSTGSKDDVRRRISVLVGLSFFW